jgi:hypothetical protein
VLLLPPQCCYQCCQCHLRLIQHHQLPQGRSLHAGDRPLLHPRPVVVAVVWCLPPLALLQHLLLLLLLLLLPLQPVGVVTVTPAASLPWQPWPCVH